MLRRLGESVRMRIYKVLAATFWAALPMLGFAAPPQRPPITGIAHVAFASRNLDADRRFFTETLGWTAVPSPEFPGGVRFYGDPRQTVEIRPAASVGEPVMLHVAWATPDAEAMRVYLQAKGVAVPAKLTRLADGERVFDVQDPEGNTVEFVQKPVRARVNPVQGAVSGRIIHAGFIVRSAATEDRFYRDILGFHPYWAGGAKEGRVDWQSAQVPDGTDWVEYMLNIPADASPKQIGVQDHLALGVADMDPAAAELRGRGWTPSDSSKKQMGRDGKVQLNLYDPDLARVELMEFRPRQTPCCSPITGREPGVDR